MSRDEFYTPSDGAPSDLDAAPATCPSCHLALPVTGTCDECS